MNSKIIAVVFLCVATGALPASAADVGPGDRVIFSDDFSQEEIGAFPKQWTLKGPDGGGNTLSVASRNGSKFLFSETPQEGAEQTSSTAYARLPKLKDLPERFTIEFDAVLGYSRLVTDLRAEKQYDLRVGTGDSSFSMLSVTSERVISRNTQSELKLAVGQVHRVVVSVDAAFLKAYIDGQLVVSDPQGVVRPIDHIGMELSTYKSTRQDDLMFTRFRVTGAGEGAMAR